MHLDLEIIFLGVWSLIVLRRRILNLIGRIMHYGCCPSCGDSWYWNEAIGITYEALETDKNFVTQGDAYNVVSASASKSVMICEGCLDNPRDLNFSKIKNSLLERGWKSEDVVSAIFAIKRFKDGY